MRVPKVRSPKVEHRQLGLNDRTCRCPECERRRSLAEAARAWRRAHDMIEKQREDDPEPAAPPAPPGEPDDAW